MVEMTGSGPGQPSFEPSFTISQLCDVERVSHPSLPVFSSLTTGGTVETGPSEYPCTFLFDLQPLLQLARGH